MANNGGNAQAKLLSLTLHLERDRDAFGLCSQTADYVATCAALLLCDRFSLTLPSQREALIDTVGFVVNELLENAFKFRATAAIELDLECTEATVVCVIRNHVANTETATLESRLAALLHGDPAELLRRTVEEQALSGRAARSGLGWLTIRSDHGVRLGWVLEPTPQGQYVLAVTANIPISK